MSKVSVNRRRFQIRKKQKRRAKLKKLRALFASAKSKTGKDAILTKVFKIAPHLSEKEFTSALKSKK